MDEFDPAGNHLLRRLPGLFRRWELGQVIEAGKDYRVEHAGSASDGTTLYAVYACADTAAGPESEEDRKVPSAAADRLNTERAARGGPWGGLSGQRPHPGVVRSTKAAR